MNASNPSASLPGWLNQLEQAGLIRLAATEPDLEYMFRHTLIQESAYRSLVRADRRRLHRAAGEALEAQLAGREPPAELAAQLARHFEEAAEHSRALRYYTLAGDAALAGYANAEAIADYASGLACAERTPVDAAAWQHLFEARGRALELSDRFPEALANYQAMAQRAHAMGDRRLGLAASVAAGQLYATATALIDLPLAERMAADTLAEARALGEEAAEAKILWNQLNLFRFTGRVLQARDCGEQSLAIARRLDLSTQAASTLNDLVHVYAALGSWPEFERASAEAQQLWRGLGNVAMLADSLSTAAHYLSMLGQPELALSQGREANQHAQAIGNLWGQAYSLFAMIWPYWYTGQPGRALETASECVRVGQAAASWAVSFGRMRLALMYGELGDPGAGLELLRQEAESAGASDDISLSEMLATRCLLELRAAGLAPALATLETLEQARQPPLLWTDDTIPRARSAVALAQGEPARALVVTQEHVGGLRQRGVVAYLPEAMLGLAQAFLLQGRVSEAKDQLVEALALTQTMHAIMIEWAVHYALGRLEIDFGDPASAAPHWARAREIVAVIAARLPTARLRRSFLGRPELRALLGDAALLVADGG